MRWALLVLCSWVVMAAVPQGASAQRRNVQQRPGDHVVGREFFRGGGGQQQSARRTAMAPPRRFANFRKAGARALVRTGRLLGKPLRKGARLVGGAAHALAFPGTARDGAGAQGATPVLAFSPAALSKPAVAALQPTGTKPVARTVKKVRVKPTKKTYQMDEDNSVTEIYGRGENGGPDVAMGAFEYNRMSGKVQLRMPPADIAANGDQISKQVLSGSRVVEQDEYLVEYAGAFSRQYNGRARNEINMDFGGGNDAPDPRYEQLTAMAQQLREKNPEMSWEQAKQTAFVTIAPGVARALKKKGYDLAKLKISIMPATAEAHASFRVSTGDKTWRHNPVTRLAVTFRVLLTGDMVKDPILKGVGKPDAKNIVHGVSGGKGMHSTYVKKQTKIGAAAYAITLTARARSKRKTINLGTIGVTPTSIDIGPLNNIVVDETTGEQTALLADGMPYEQVALREGLAAYKGKTAPIIRQVIAGALPEMISQRANQIFAADKTRKQNPDAAYQRALGQAMLEHIPIAKDLASVGYDVTNVEVRPRGDGYMMLEFAP